MEWPIFGYLAGMELAKAVVVVPAHNELAHLPRCLRALATSAVCLPVPVLTVVVLDATDDGSERLVEEFGPDVHFVEVDAGNVGAARAAGFEYSRPLCDGVDAARTWYATTDADSVVPADWLLRMTASDADMVLGVVRVPIWRHHHGRGSPPLPACLPVKRAGPQPHSWRQHGLSRRRVLVGGRFSRTAHR